MARMRNLHPDFFTDEKVVQVSLAARLCFQGLWCEADREGRLEDKPLTLKMRLFPADNLDIEPLLAELAKVGLVQRYSAEGRRYLLVSNFKRRQHLHPKEAPSKLPPPPDGQILESEDTKTAEKLIHNPVSLENEPSMDVEPGNSRESTLLARRNIRPSEHQDLQTNTSAAILPRPEDLQEIWNRQKPGECPEWREMTTSRRRLATARLKERPLAEWEAVVKRIANSSFCRGKTERGWVADVDFLLRPDTAAKVLEGKYDNRGGAKPTRPDPNEGITTRPTETQKCAVCAAVALAKTWGTWLCDEHKLEWDGEPVFSDSDMQKWVAARNGKLRQSSALPSDSSERPPPTPDPRDNLVFGEFRGVA